MPLDTYPIRAYSQPEGVHPATLYNEDIMQKIFFRSAFVAALLLGAPAYAGGNHTPGGGTVVPTPAPVTNPATNLGQFGIGVVGGTSVFAQGTNGSGAAQFARNLGEVSISGRGPNMQVFGQGWSGTHGSGFGPNGAVQGFAGGNYAGFGTFAGPGCGC